MAEIFRCKDIPKYYCFVKIFSAKAPARTFRKVVVIFRVIPAVCCSAERSISVLQRRKINLRSTMGQDYLIHITLLCSECAYANRAVRSFSGPYFPACRLNTERYSVSLRSQFECRKIRTRKTPNTENSVIFWKVNFELHILSVLTLFFER